jgi:hypothetical protein
LAMGRLMSLRAVEISGGQLREKGFLERRTWYTPERIWRERARTLLAIFLGQTVSLDQMTSTSGFRSGRSSTTAAACDL